MRAIFLDRDGCLNEDWFNPATKAWESPMTPADLVLRPNVIEALRRLQELGYALFLVSNQPSFAKGKCSLEDLKAVHARFAALMEENHIRFREYYYSYHHPDGIVPAYSGPSPDRKPNPYYLNLAAERHGVNLAQSWMIGDRDTDVECGQKAGTHTIQVANPRGDGYVGKAAPDFSADDLLAAAALIAAHSPK